MDPLKNFEENNSLEAPDTSADNSGPSKNAESKPVDESNSSPVTENKVSFRRRIQSRVYAVNIYLLLFVMLVLLASMAVFVAVQNSRKANNDSSLITQDLTPEALEQLRNSDVKVGDPKQTLNVESNAIFTGKVLIRDSLDVAGQIRVGGALSLPGITVSGTSSFDEVQINNLAISGNTSILGQLSVQSNLSVTGNASFGGSLSAGQLVVDNLQLSGDLAINRHINGGGAIPKVATGSSAGSGGTTSISGSDTAGTVTINTGGSPAAGTLATVTFANAFSQTPHVVASPTSSGGSSLNYYISRTSTGFSIISTNTPPAGTTIVFDFVAFD